MVLALVCAADVLFIDRQAGISIPLFLCLIGLAALLTNTLRLTSRTALVWTALFVAGLLPAIETAGGLPVFFASAGTAILALGMSGRLSVPWPVAARRVGALLTANLCGRLNRLRRGRRYRRHPALASLGGLLLGWGVPLLVGGLFAMLFSYANPAFWSWIRLLDPLLWLQKLDLPRLLFWLAIAALVVPFIRIPAFPRPGQPIPGPARPGTFPKPSPSLVLRSLVVVNLVFSLQTTLDLVHIWGGVALPEGMTAAGNAHKAAYILIVSALLAAGMVLLATPDPARSADGPARPVLGALLHLWVAQNIVLVLSAMLRLELYVDLYSLTRFRMAAFIWMGLVAAGLLLIEIRILLRRSGRWLIGANLLAAATVLYGCAIADLDAFAAWHNVRHNFETTSSGAPLDRHYLCDLGTSALPAIDSFIARRELESSIVDEHMLRDCAARLRMQLVRSGFDWRAWTLRDHRLRHYVQNHTPGEVDHARQDTGSR